MDINLDSPQGKTEKAGQDLVNTGKHVSDNVVGFIQANKKEIMIAGGIVLVLLLLRK